MQMKPSFLTADRPLITAMIEPETVEEGCCLIAQAMQDGAEAYGIQLENLRREERGEDKLRALFAACAGKPIYITSYRNVHNADLSDEERVELLLRGVKCGATLADVMGDVFSPDPTQLTDDPDAVRRQIDLARQIHEMGAEVLISSHLSRFADADEIVRMAKEQERRGADIAKIVSFADNEAQLTEDMRITFRLKEELRCKFLFLANGAECRRLRLVGPLFGSCMFLCRSSYRPYQSKAQPFTRSTRIMRDEMALY